MGVLQSSLDVSDRPETTWKPKRELSPGKVVFVRSLSSVGGMLMSDVYIYFGVCVKLDIHKIKGIGCYVIQNLIVFTLYQILFFSWLHSPYWARVSSLARLHDHTQTHHTMWESFGQVIGASQRRLPDHAQQLL